MEKFVIITKEHYEEWKSKETDKEKLDFFNSLYEKLFEKKYKIKLK